MVLQFLRSRAREFANTLVKTKSHFTDRLHKLLHRGISEEMLDELEELLFEADLGAELSCNFTEIVRKHAKKEPNASFEEYITLLRDEALEILKTSEASLTIEGEKPLIYLICGVNGSGKTTSVAKLAYLLQKSGKKVLIGACDTFRAAAKEQLEVFAEKYSIPLCKGKHNADPASVAFDAITQAKEEGIDIVLLDSSGRLENKTNLMKQLEKMGKIAEKLSSNGLTETLLTLDSHTGQNGIDQAKIFNQFTPLSGLILTKFDSTSKGGAALAICKQLKLPIKFIGLGESIEDLTAFEKETYIEELFS